jgi:hypothetical protein
LVRMWTLLTAGVIQHSKGEFCDALKLKLLTNGDESFL